MTLRLHNKFGYKRTSHRIYIICTLIQILGYLNFFPKILYRILQSPVKYLKGKKKICCHKYKLFLAYLNNLTILI